MAGGDLRVCFAGDSLVNGTNDPECLGWTGRVVAAARRAGHDVTHYNLGVRRETAADILARLPHELPPRLTGDFQPLLVLCFGVNDTFVLNGRMRLSMAESLEAAERLLSFPYPTLLISPPAVPDPDHMQRLHALSAELAALAAAKGVPYLDVLTPLQTDADWMRETAADDGFHPQAAGYTAFARLVQKWTAMVEFIYG